MSSHFSLRSLVAAEVDATRASDEAARARSWPALGREFLLALLPTLTVLATFALVARYAEHRLLFASLASSAFSIYISPAHRMNRIRTLLIAQGGAALIAYGATVIFGPSYAVAGVCVVLVIALMVLLDVMHPPAVSTALSFGFTASKPSSLVIFAIALGMLILLVLLQRAMHNALHRNSSEHAVKEEVLSHDV